MKHSLTTKLLDRDMQAGVFTRNFATQGIGELSFNVRQRIIDGPASCMDRHVTLMMQKAEVIEMVRRLPYAWLEEAGLGKISPPETV